MAENKAGEKFFKPLRNLNGCYDYEKSGQLLQWAEDNEKAYLEGEFTPEEMIGIARGMLLRSAGRKTDGK